MTKYELSVLSTCAEALGYDGINSKQLVKSTIENLISIAKVSIVDDESDVTNQLVYNTGTLLRSALPGNNK